jgi:hypothetical protein
MADETRVVLVDRIEPLIQPLRGRHVILDSEPGGTIRRVHQAACATSRPANPSGRASGAARRFSCFAPTWPRRRKTRRKAGFLRVFRGVTTSCHMWRRGELNPGPEVARRELLRV